MAFGVVAPTLDGPPSLKGSLNGNDNRPDDEGCPVDKGNALAKLWYPNEGEAKVLVSRVTTGRLLRFRGSGAE